MEIRQKSTESVSNTTDVVWDLMQPSVGSTFDDIKYKPYQFKYKHISKSSGSNRQNNFWQNLLFLHGLLLTQYTCTKNILTFSYLPSYRTMFPNLYKCLSTDGLWSESLPTSHFFRFGSRKSHWRLNLVNMVHAAAIQSTLNGDSRQQWKKCDSNRKGLISLPHTGIWS